MYTNGNNDICITSNFYLSSLRTYILSVFHILCNSSVMSWVYSRYITSQQVALIRRHSASLLEDSLHRHTRDHPPCRDGGITHSGHDCNGFSLDPDKTSPPDEQLMWTSKSLHELDEYYTRRVLGFESVQDMWQWMSCVDLMKKVNDFPLLLVNSLDDPVVPPEIHSVPIQYTGSTTFISR